MERLIEFERRNLEASGATRAEVFSKIRKLSEFYALFLEQRRLPGAIVGERPDLASVWNDAPGHQYGRSAQFLHQLQAIDPGSAWAAVKVPTLVLWGDADIVMHRADHERLANIVNSNGAGLAQFHVIAGADHGLVVRRPEGGPAFAARAVDLTLEFLRRL
ncbi:MAG TPA: alpha/beta hydrolase [Vicinamibacterales bacterium]|nr:alpha/beta hydrolase [Vicinamibacterales bacterium]